MACRSVIRCERGMRIAVMREREVAERGEQRWLDGKERVTDHQKDFVLYYSGTSSADSINHHKEEVEHSWSSTVSFVSPC